MSDLNAECAPVCAWTLHDRSHFWDYFWESSCGRQENGVWFPNPRLFSFCPYCGRKIVVEGNET